MQASVIGNLPPSVSGRERTDVYLDGSRFVRGVRQPPTIRRKRGGGFVVGRVQEGGCLPRLPARRVVPLESQDHDVVISPRNLSFDRAFDEGEVLAIGME